MRCAPGGRSGTWPCAPCAMLTEVQNDDRLITGLIWTPPHARPLDLGAHSEDSARGGGTGRRGRPAKAQAVRGGKRRKCAKEKRNERGGASSLSVQPGSKSKSSAAGPMIETILIRDLTMSRTRQARCACRRGRTPAPSLDQRSI